MKVNELQRTFFKPFRSVGFTLSKDLPTILKSILESKREEVTAQKKKYSLEDVVSELKEAPRIRPFKTALLEKVEQGLPAVITEIKKGSPSKGILCERFELQNIALSYEEANACCISVLTDSQYFYGSDNDPVKLDQYLHCQSCGKI